MSGLIYEVRAESKGKTHAHGAYHDREEAETALVAWREQITRVGGKNDRYWVEEINTDGLFKIPSEPTPRERFHSDVTRVEQSPGHWDTTKIRIVDRAHADKIVGEYERNYTMLRTFEPFRQGDRNFALIAPHYTATSVMDLDTGEIIAEEEPDARGFCPVGFYVPDWWDVNDGSILPGSTYWDEDEEWPVGDFGFVWGCHWGDDWSWKVQYLDLSEVAKGVLKRDDRYGYLSLATHPGKLEPQDFIRVSKDGGSVSVQFDVEQYYNLDGISSMNDYSLWHSVGAKSYPVKDPSQEQAPPSLKEHMLKDHPAVMKKQPWPRDKNKQFLIHQHHHTRYKPMGEHGHTHYTDDEQPFMGNINGFPGRAWYPNGFVTGGDVHYHRDWNKKKSSVNDSYQREQRKVRSTGTTVSLYDGAHPDGSDFNPDDGGRWVTFCEDHGEFVQHDNIGNARAFLAHPEEWCMECQEKKYPSE